MYVFFRLFNESPRGFKFFAVIHLNFKPTEEVFRYAVIQTVSFSGHALSNAVFGKKIFGIRHVGIANLDQNETAVEHQKAVSQTSCLTFHVFAIFALLTA